MPSANRIMTIIRPQREAPMDAKVRTDNSVNGGGKPSHGAAQ